MSGRAKKFRRPTWLVLALAIRLDTLKTSCGFESLDIAHCPHAASVDDFKLSAKRFQCLENQPRAHCTILTSDSADTCGKTPGNISIWSYLRSTDVVEPPNCNLSGSTYGARNL